MINILSEGGYFFMTPLAILLIATIVLIIKYFVSPSHKKKTLKLIQSIGLFALVWGVLGQVMGLITAFDTIEFIDGVSLNIVAGGLKRTFLPTLLGLVIFLVARFGILIIQWREKE